MSRDENQRSLAPSMERTKIQLETSYAPGSLFTFEGNLVVCESLPKDDYRSATFLSHYSEAQILFGVEERIVTWFDAGMRSENDPRAFMCVDKYLLNDDETGLKDTFRNNLFGFAEPSQMGYVPTLLTMVCNKCKKVKVFSTLNNFDSRRDELSPGNCTVDPNGDCTWRQMDIVFIHPNGNYCAPVPWIYDYDTKSNSVIMNLQRCTNCGNTEVRIDEKSAQIGKRYFYCADCKMKRGKEDRWLQNDKEWLRKFGSDSVNRVADIRMKAISYRSNSVHYPLQDMVIDFGKSEQLSVLTDSTSQSLVRAVAERFALPTTEPDRETIKSSVINSYGQDAWDEYESSERNLKRMEELKSTIDDSDDAFDQTIQLYKESMANKRSAWQTAGLFSADYDIPHAIMERLTNRRELFSGRYDPFRLLIEHSTLLERIISGQRMENGMSHFTEMDRLDEYIGPDSEEKRSELNKEHRMIMDEIGVEIMGLARKFETLQYSFGYSRVASTPVTRYINDREIPVRLNLFRKTRIDEDRKHPIFVLKQNNEAIYVRLNETAVREWLNRLNTSEDITDAPLGQQYLENVPAMGMFLDSLPNPESPSMPLAIYTLLHTYAHHIMMGVSEFSGLSVSSLGEYIFPTDLAFIVYRRGMTMDMGNLTSMLRNNAPAFLKYMRDTRNLGCGSGSLCLRRGGACPDCLLIPEVSCIAQNKLLSRTVLIGKDHPQDYGFNTPIQGFLSVAKEGYEH
ncbi:MAG: hypothetical protein PF440_04015 [Thiomicrorhabdus sp.]|jgi:hypothetical protein|nr:hypothetical protein [Thiomicrorhabdus sp.]